MQQTFTTTKFTDLPINQTVLQGIRDAGFDNCTPVQEKILPLALGGKNIAAQSQTGTGKTATFLITLFNHLLNNPSGSGKKQPRALILAPTRELVVQIDQEAKLLGTHTGLQCQPVFGGIDYDKQKQALLQHDNDVVIATPGRLIDYLKQKIFSLKEIEVLIIDEADRMFDLGFIPDLRYILRRCSPYNKRQSLLFSATLSFRVMELAYEHLDIHESITISPEQLTAEKIQQSLYHVGKREKMALFLGLLAKEQPDRALVFSNTKRMADILVDYLKANGHLAASLTGDVPQQKRLSILERFKKKQLSILVATDVASRGLHIDNVTHVFNYDLPQDPEDYVHRIGRTARVGATGKAISLASEDDAFYLEPIESLAGKIPLEWVEDGNLATDITVPKKRPPRTDKPGGQRPKRPTGGNKPAGHRRTTTKESKNRTGSNNQKRGNKTRTGTATRQPRKDSSTVNQ
ncbi:MAG: DEAD/DEAH box helicase [Deltaproteobacteria bacterium]|nr:DEAD/DEAH box helicase [Candidatus Anaeroferrophillus wilburensis]MBN2888435.1 DEAD/DEAH box helicase [Deltaproteobacteria bacterium]